MKTVNLCGEWTVRKAGTTDEFTGQVPGCIHTDLLSNGRIEDPFDRDNELKQFWIGETDWEYTRTFEVGKALLAHETVLLECDGLDTIATIKVNGKVVARTDNMFRAWSFDVAGSLRAGTNEISVLFKAPLAYGRKSQTKRALHPVNSGHRITGVNWMRKEQCNFGWDWGPQCPTVGIWRAIRVRAFSVARLADVHATQDHTGRGVTVNAAIEAEKTGRAALAARITLSLGRTQAAATEIPLKGSKANAALRVSKPELWWPNGMGDQPLYDLKIELLGKDGKALDTWTRKIGLRTLDVVRNKDKWGESFMFACNGKTFFAKGANWIPNDVFQNRVTRDHYEFQVRSSAEANMNFLRVWGGGIYEQDDFYELCDQYGICVWQDFMFACAAYPSFDPDFMATVEQEAIQNVKRLRHHASLAIWCGNNELEMMKAHTGEPGSPRNTLEEYKDLFERLLPKVCAKHDPQRTYWQSSGHTPGNLDDSDNPAAGDAHLWEVWHGRKPFEWYRTAFHRFCSEFGFQSFPEPRTVYSYTNEEERNVTSFVMEHHQRSGIGNSTIMHYMLSWFRMPSGFENTLWLSQIQQGLAIKYAVEHWRRNMPQCMGALYWQQNDCWPVASWASIDSLDRWKALHFMARSFYKPVLVSGLEDNVKGAVEVHISSDLQTASKAKLEWQVTDVNGKELARGDKAVNVPANSSKRVETLKLKDLAAKRTERDLMVWLYLKDARGKELSRNFVSFCRPKHMALPDPKVAVKVTAKKGGAAYEVTLKARRPALWAWLQLAEADAHYEDNFICLEPARETRITVTPAQKLSLAAFKRQLKVQSLYNTYQ